MNKVAILVSGSGTNMENLIKTMQAGELAAKVVVVIGDREGIASKERAEKLNVPYKEVSRKSFQSKMEFEEAIEKVLLQFEADWVILAGFMRILSDDFVLNHWGRIINIHPSYLPAFPGAHGIEDAFNAKVRKTGVTVHFVDTGVDTGHIILQREVSILAKDTLESLESRVHAEEYELYPEALRRVFEGKVSAPAKP